jgi:hypothetical protein
MFLIVAAAILGAAVGLFVRPRIFALAVAISVSGATHLMLGLMVRLLQKDRANAPLLERLDLLTFSDVHGIWPVMAAAGTGTLIAALAWSVAQKESTDRFWFIPGEKADRRQGIRSMSLVEERPAHEEARRKLDAILGPASDSQKI